jgi:hypothetical protein
MPHTQRWLGWWLDQTFSTVFGTAPAVPKNCLSMNRCTRPANGSSVTSILEESAIGLTARFQCPLLDLALLNYPVQNRILSWQPMPWSSWAAVPWPGAKRRTAIEKGSSLAAHLLTGHAQEWAEGPPAPITCTSMVQPGGSKWINSAGFTPGAATDGFISIRIQPGCLKHGWMFGTPAASKHLDCYLSTSRMQR